MADKSKTIKNASDKELDELLIRLRKESELQYLVREIKRNSEDTRFTSYDDQKISTEQPIDSLYHYGILGMKWGRRKAHKNLAPTADKATDHSRPNLRRKSLNELSDAELRELTTRMQLEKQYKDLNKKELSIGKKFVNDVLNESAKKAATAYVSKYMVKGLDSLEKALKGATK